jgi:Ala-tRNA(Pro) deacylase
LAVFPASYSIDFDLLKRIVGSDKVELATEREFKNLFPGCEVGAMPPFGNLFGMDVVVEESLSRDSEIAFNAGLHSELIKLAYGDYERSVKPKIGKFLSSKVHA